MKISLKNCNAIQYCLILIEIAVHCNNSVQNFSQVNSLSKCFNLINASKEHRLSKKNTCIIQTFCYKTMINIFTIT